jgi:hypothetical protein
VTQNRVCVVHQAVSTAQFTVNPDTRGETQIRSYRSGQDLFRHLTVSVDHYLSNCDTPYVDILKPFQRTDKGLWQKVYVLPLPQSVKELLNRIRDAVMSLDEDMLRRVWDEIAFRWDVCRITRGYVIERL